jgi:hypothetical protein
MKLKQITTLFGEQHPLLYIKLLCCPLRVSCNQFAGTPMEAPLGMHVADRKV